MINSFVERTFVGKTCNHRHVVCTIHVFVNHNPTLKKNNHVSENRGYVYPKNVDIKNDDQPKQSIVFFSHCFHMAKPAQVAPLRADWACQNAPSEVAPSRLGARGKPWRSCGGWASHSIRRVMVRNG